MNSVENLRTSMLRRIESEITNDSVVEKVKECQRTLEKTGIRKQLEDLPLVFGKVSTEEEIQESGKCLSLVISWRSKFSPVDQNFIIVRAKKDRLTIHGGHFPNSENTDFYFAEFEGEELVQSNEEITKAFVTAVTYPRTKKN